MKPIKIAIVGAGNMASEHAKAFSSLPDVTLVGITSRTISRAEELASKYPGMQVFNTIEEMYLETKADLVVVTVREMSMADVAIECFKFSWAILLEKPAGYCLKNARKILDASKVRNSKVWVALNRRSYSSTLKALNELKDVDGPRFIQILDQQNQVAAREIYKEPPEVVENYMFANSIHLIDYLRVFGRGKITNVIPVCKWTPQAPGMVVTKVEFDSGDIGVYEGVWNGPGPWGVTVITPSKRLEMRPLEAVSLQLFGERKVMQLDLNSDDHSYKPGLRQQAIDVLRACRGEESSTPTLEDAFLSMKLVAEIFSLPSSE